MALPPPLDSRTFENVKYVYTDDSGNEYLTTFRHYKNINGEPFLPLPNCIVSVQQQGNKDKFWGLAKQRRRAEIKVVNPDNQTGETNTFLPIPQRPLNGTAECYKEIRELVTSIYPSGTGCIDYRGENRTTNIRPRRLREFD